MDLKPPELQGLDYSTFRSYMQRLAHVKAKLNEIIMEKRKEYQLHIEHQRKYLDLMEKEQQLRQMLIDNIPEKY